MTLHAKVGLLKQHDVVTQESLRFARGRITRSQLQVVYAEQEIGDEAHTQRTNMTEQDSEASNARAEAAEQRAKILQVLLGSAWMDVKDLVESYEADRFEMAELWSRAHDIKARF
ncbi:hypothetical protein Tco_0699707 [Tanacetum coccineum]